MNIIKELATIMTKYARKQDIKRDKLGEYYKVGEKGSDYRYLEYY